MARELLVGVDVGSTTVKAGLIGVDGELVSLRSKALPVHTRSNGAVEHDMDDVAAVALEVVAEVAAMADPARVVGVGICGQGDGCWLLDGKCRPVRASISWRDTRRSPCLDRELPVPRGSTVAILAWLSDCERDTLARARSVVFAKDWVRYCLTGELATDPTDSATLRGVRVAGWVPAELRREIDRLIPPLLPSAGIAGHVNAKGGAATGLRVGTPVVTGALDVVAAVLGAGATTVGDTVSILGTAGIHTRLRRVPDSDSPTNHGGATPTIPYLIQGEELAVMATAAACPNVDWVLATCWADPSGPETRACAFGEADRAGAGAGGVIFHPYISPAGERAPFLQTSARAQFFGLDSRHSRGHLLRAALEGVAFATRECYDVLGRGDHVVLAGAAGASSLWCQVLADVLGAEVRVGANVDAGPRGAAALAGVGVGLYRDAAHAAAVLSVSGAKARRYGPDAGVGGLYDSLYGLYRDLRGALVPYWGQRVALEPLIADSEVRT